MALSKKEIDKIVDELTKRLRKEPIFVPAMPLPVPVPYPVYPGTTGIMPGYPTYPYVTYGTTAAGTTDIRAEG